MKTQITEEIKRRVHRINQDARWLNRNMRGWVVEKSVSFDPCVCGVIRLLDLVKEQSTGYRLFIRLQDSNYELDSEHDTFGECLKRAIHCITGPLGSSAMYEIHRNGVVIRSNSELIGLVTEK